VRTTVDELADGVPECGTVDGATYVLGRTLGTARICDVWCKLAAGQSRAINLATAKPSKHELAPLQDDTGWPAFAGIPLVPAAGEWLRKDGAHWLLHLHARIGPMLHADLWTWVAPGQPWARGELVICASN